MADWDARFLGLAQHVSTWSKDPSTKVGAVLIHPRDHAVVSTGFNGFAPGADDSPHLYADREYKYAHVIHAEVNALRLSQVPTTGLWLYSSFPCCPNCLRAALDAGVSRVVQAELNTIGRPECWVRQWQAWAEESRRFASHKGIILVDRAL